MMESEVGFVEIERAALLLIQPVSHGRLSFPDRGGEAVLRA